MPDDAGFSRDFSATAWMQRLDRNDQGATKPTIGNAGILLTNDPLLAGMFAFNEFTSEHVMTRAAPSFEDGVPGLPGPYPRTWQISDVALVLAYLQRQWSPQFKKQTVEDALVTAAEHNRFHPVRAYLLALEWDGKPRIDTWLHMAFGTPDDGYHAAIGSKFLIASVRRILKPGTKFDSLLVLEGAQGIGKSRACQALASPEWFSDALPHDLGSRDAALGLLGKWIIELGELDSLIRSEVETVKAFLSRETDRYRPPYGKTFVERQRQGTLIGTTNQSDYLRDSTGNRRFWPAKCEKAEHAWIAEVRDQLWAEAVEREAMRETLWLDAPSLSRSAVHHQASRLAEDPWSTRILNWIAEGGRVEVRTPDVLQHCLQLDAAAQTRGNEMRVAGVLRANGYQQCVYKPRGAPKTIRSWWPPGAAMPNGKRVPEPEVETTDGEVVTE